MDLDQAKLLFGMLRDSGLYSAEKLAAAEKVCTTKENDQKFADSLLKLGMLTNYQHRKLRHGRIAELLFGSYLILDKLGEGGMGKVFRAVQPHLRRMVALKVIRPQLMMNKVALSRYKREAEASGSLDHPNIVKLLDADVINGRYYLAMEYIDGIDLSRLVKEFGTPPTSGLADPEEVCEYIRQASLGLQHAHSRNLVHRDIKPANMLVYGSRALPGTSGAAVVKILDMGLVRTLDEDEDSSKSELTRDGTVVGTPDYMAPEQAKNSSTVDGRADLYAMGCSMFYMLRGQPPFPNGSPIEKLLQHQVDPIPDIRRFRPDVPVVIADLITKLLQKQPHERVQSAGEVADILGRFLGRDGYSSSASANSNHASPSHEPFSLAATPESIATLPVTDSPASEEPALPPPSSPSLRLRVVAPATPSAPVSAPRRVERVPAPQAIPVPKPDTSSSAEFSGGSDTTRTNRVKTPSEKSGPVKRPRPQKTPVAKTSPGSVARKKADMPILTLVIAGLAVVALLAITGFLVFGGSDDPITTTTDTKPTGSTVSTKTPIRPGEIPPLAAVLPTRDSAVLVTYPAPFWNKVFADPVAGSRIISNADWLTEKNGFDIRRFTRGIVAFESASEGSSVIAIGEGPYQIPGWTYKQGALLKAQQTVTDGVSIYSLPEWKTSERVAVVSTDPAPRLVALAEDRRVLVGYMKRSEPSPSDSPELLSALSIAEPTLNPPLLTFVATKDWVLPGGRKLGDWRVDWVRTLIRLEENELAVEVQLHGADRAPLVAFVSEYIGVALPEKYPATAPFSQALILGQQSDRRTARDYELTVRKRIAWKSFITHLEALLPDPPR